MSGRTKRSDSVMVAKVDEEIAEASTAAPGDEAPALSVTDGGVWFVLERASLEAAKVGKVRWALLSVLGFMVFPLFYFLRI